jgi:hypothetical protein
LFVKPEELRHVPRTSFVKFATNVLRGYVFIPGELHYSKKSKNVLFRVPLWECYFIFEFLKIRFKNLYLGLGVLYIISPKQKRPNQTEVYFI